MNDSDRPHRELEVSREETRAAFQNRAMLYFYLYEEMAERFGPEAAEDVMSAAIRRRGHDIGTKYRQAADVGDLDQVGSIFCGGSPCDGGLFSPSVEERGEDHIVLRMDSCPLKEAWEEMGLDEAQVDLMCRIAAAVDEGTFEAAGLELTFKDRLGSPGSRHCLLELRPGSGD